MIPFSEVTSEPAKEPISFYQVKQNAFLEDDTSQDGYIKDWLIPEARRFVEQLANRSLITQTRVQYYDDLYPEIWVRYGPLQSVTSITYKDSNEDQQTLTSTLYTADTKRIPGRIFQGYDETYPTAICDTNSVAVTVVCGFGDDAADVPIIYRRAMIMWCCLQLHNRVPIACADDYQKALGALQQLIAIEGSTVEYA